MGSWLNHLTPGLRRQWDLTGNILRQRCVRALDADRVRWNHWPYS
jgi:hypothetical protein